MADGSRVLVVDDVDDDAVAAVMAPTRSSDPVASK